MTDKSQSGDSTLVRNLRAILTEIDDALREAGAPEKHWSDPDGPQVFSIKALAAERDRYRSELSAVSDEMVQRAAIVFYRVGQKGGESLHDWSKRQMRAALEAALADPVGADSELTPRGRA